MLAKTASHPAHSPRTIRVAWWVAFAITIALVVGLGMARSADAANLALPGPSASIQPPFEDGEECEADEPDCAEEEGEGEEECELDEDGFEECVGSEEDEDEAPPECLLTTARPRISIAADQERLRLDVRYTLAAPADVSISLRSSGSKGALALPAGKRHLSRSGSFHETTQLTGTETERALAAKQFTVRLHVLDVPGSCNRYEFRHLRVRRGGEQSPVFSETGADLRAGR
ncbi:MAG: hypothetical protein ABW065_11435 [Solirubrobacterales bacterium]